MIFLKKYTQFELLKNIYVFAYTRVMYILIKMNWWLSIVNLLDYKVSKGI